MQACIGKRSNDSARVHCGAANPFLIATPADALAITHNLCVEGNRKARLLAEQIEKACRAALPNPD